MGLLDRFRSKKQGATVQDPVCKMDIDPEQAAGTARHGAGTYHFCSMDCLERFEHDPHQYLGHHAH